MAAAQDGQLERLTHDGRIAAGITPTLVDRALQALRQGREPSPIDFQRNRHAL